jgi:2,4-didehydro-3-deoxy-L-rhamnonate hydrolase
MRFANHDGRLLLVAAGEDGGLPDRGTDLYIASGGAIPAKPEHAYERWDEVLAIARELSEAPADVTIDPDRLGSPSPVPRQIFGVGLNYSGHAGEAGMAVPEVPLIFTKLQPSVTGPYGVIELSTTTVDWEVEVAVVIGSAARDVAAADAWSVVAGVTAGQDLSDREIQMRPATTPQFGLGKSLPGFTPLGPILVTPDEFRDPDDIELACTLNGVEVQRDRSSAMLFSTGELIEYLSAITPLWPGDVIFTGTPGGIGMAQDPPRYLQPGDELESFVEGVGHMRHTFGARP